LTFEEAMERYGAIANRQSSELAESENADKGVLYQEARIWLWENLDKIEQWEADGLDRARRAVKTRLRYVMKDYLASERHAVSGATLIPVVGDDDDIPLDKLNVSPLPVGTGDQAEYCGCPAGQEIQPFREIMAAIGRLTPDQQAVLREVFIDGLTYKEAALRRGLHMTAVGKRVKRLIDQIREDAGIHLAERKPPVPLHSGSEGYGIPGAHTRGRTFAASADGTVTEKAA